MSDLDVAMRTASTLIREKARLARQVASLTEQRDRARALVVALWGEIENEEPE